MTVPRASAALGRTVLRRASGQARSRAWRQLGRRGYASEHGKQSSEIPWLIGSVAFTVPAAVWLLGQAPKKDAHHEVEKEGVKEVVQQSDKDKDDEEEAEGGSDEKSDEGSGEEKKDESAGDSGSDDSKDESSDEKSDDSSGDEKESKDEGTQTEGEDDGPSPGAPGQINYKPGSGKGPGEGQKGERRPVETKGEKDAAKDSSGAKHPYLDDDEKSKKGEGLKETQKIHGTVDSNRPAR